MAFLAVIVLFVVRCCSTLSAEGRLNIKKIYIPSGSVDLKTALFGKLTVVLL